MTRWANTTCCGRPAGSRCGNLRILVATNSLPLGLQSAPDAALCRAISPPHCSQSCILAASCWPECLYAHNPEEWRSPVAGGLWAPPRWLIPTCPIHMPPIKVLGLANAAAAMSALACAAASSSCWTDKSRWQAASGSVPSRAKMWLLLCRWTQLSRALAQQRAPAPPPKSPLSELSA